MRVTTPVSFRLLKGDPQLAKLYQSWARTLLGRMKSYAVGTSQKRTWTLPDGAVIITRSTPAGDFIDIDVSAVTAESKVLIEFLAGFTTTPHSSAFPNGLGTGSTEHTYDVAVFGPKTLELLDQSYKLFLYDETYKPDTTTQFTQYHLRRDGRVWHKVPLRFGNIDWWGKNDVVLSWDGIPTRYFDGAYFIFASFDGTVVAPWDTREAHGQVIADITETGDSHHAVSNYAIPVTTELPSIFCRGDYVYVQPASPASAVPLSAPVVCGAAIVKSTTPGSSKQFLVFAQCIGSAPASRVLSERFCYAEILSLSTERLTVKPFVVTTTQAWGDINLNNPASPILGFNKTAWLFNESGTQGVTNRTWDNGVRDAGKYSATQYRTFLNVTATDSGVVFVVVQDIATNSGSSSSTSNSSQNGDGRTFDTASASGSSDSEVTTHVADYVGDTLVTGTVKVTGHFDSSSSVSHTGDTNGILTGNNSLSVASTAALEVIFGTATFSGSYSGSTVGSSSFTSPIGGIGHPTTISETISGNGATLAFAAADLRADYFVLSLNEYSSNGSLVTRSQHLKAKRGVVELFDQTVVLSTASTGGSTSFVDGANAGLLSGGSSSSSSSTSTGPPDYATVATSQGVRYSHAVLPKPHNVLFEIPIGFEQDNWETLGKPMAVYLDGQDPFAQLVMPGTDKRLWPVGEI